MENDVDEVLCAINKVACFFGVALKTSMESHSNALLCCEKDCIIMNIGLNEDNDVWWEGIGYDSPGNLLITHALAIIGMILKTFQFLQFYLVTEALQQFLWLINHLIRIMTFWFDSIFESKITAATLDLKVGSIRSDSSAMLPFCDYHMGNYFQHWIDVERAYNPKTLFMDWFRNNKDGKWLWPGYDDNSSVLVWVEDKTGISIETQIGDVATLDAIQRLDA